MKMIRNTRFLFFLIPLIFSCKSYRQDILFAPDDQSQLQKAVYDTEKNYRIQVNDFLQMRIYTNDGERAIDPNGELAIRQGSQNYERQNPIQYQVLADGTVKFPMIGMVSMEGLTLNEGEKALESRFNEYFKGAFVKLAFQNKRAIVLGHISMVVPLENDNTSLLEVLSLAGGVNFGSRAHNIRVIRGDLSDPEVYVVDLTSVTGLKNSIIDIQPGDIIYLEPWRRPWLETIRDVSPVIGLVTSIITLAFLLSNL